MKQGSREEARSDAVAKHRAPRDPARTVSNTHHRCAHGEHAQRLPQPATKLFCPFSSNCVSPTLELIYSTIALEGHFRRDLVHYEPISEPRLLVDGNPRARACGRAVMCLGCCGSGRCQYARAASRRRS